MSKSIQKLSVLLLALLLIIGLIPASVTAVSNPSVSYRTHVQNDGWQDWKKDGTMSGTSGKSLRLEGIEVKLDTQGYDLGIDYQTHIQNIGWEADTERGWKSNGTMSGTEGLSYRLEAIQIKLTGADAKKFDIYYQVHAQNMGWLGWAKNGESAGTAGYGYRLEGIRILIVPVGSAMPSGKIDKSDSFYMKPEYIDSYILLINDLYNAKLNYKGDGIPIASYSLFDMDNNGVPELLLTSGTGAVDLNCNVFTYRNDQFEYVGEFHIGHTALYGKTSDCCGQLIGVYGQMLAQHVFEISIINGKLNQNTVSSGGVNSTDDYFKTDYPVPEGNVDDLSLLNAYVNKQLTSSTN